MIILECQCSCEDCEGFGGLWIACRGKDGKGRREHAILVMSGIHINPPNNSPLFILSYAVSRNSISFFK